MTERLIIKTVPLLIALLVSGCYYDVAEVLYPAGACNTDNMSYQNHIVPILQRNCYTCHSAAVNTGNVTLEGHDKLLPYATSGKLMGVIRHESGFTAMPQNASKLIDCDIAKIGQWVLAGAPNN